MTTKSKQVFLAKTLLIITSSLKTNYLSDVLTGSIFRLGYDWYTLSNLLVWLLFSYENKY